MSTNITREMLYGKRPVYRINPQTGKKEWYYLDPRGADTITDMKTIDVENENSPNPQANAIQNYLYENDEYNYNLLYGNTPPPSSAQTQTVDATSTLPINQPNNITQATPNLNQDFQPSIFTQQKRRNVENDLLMDAMDMLYGMNRGINGMTLGGLDWLGNKFGFDSKMNNYLDLKDDKSRAITEAAGNVAEIAGASMTGKYLNDAAKYGYNQANMLYNGYKIGKEYDILKRNPYQGQGSDVIARMKNYNGEPVILQRGEAIPRENGSVIVSGHALKRETGTERNYGLDKIIYKHEMPRSDVMQIPRLIRQNQPTIISPRGQNIYMIQQPNGEIRLVISPRENYNTISSMYFRNR